MIKIICLGKLKEEYLKKLCEDYLKRINRYHKIQIINLDDELNIEKETINLKKIIKKTDFNIVLDINGKEYDSKSFSNLIYNTFNHYSTISFIIGSSHGIDESIKVLANERISFSKFTMPHGLFRGILLEQIYRSFKIINNEEYHK